MKRNSYSITANGISSCSGSCSYCSAGVSMDYTLAGRPNLDKLYDKLLEIDKKTYESEYRADYDALEKKLDCDEHDSKVRFDIWGGDPIASYTYLQDIVEFLEYYCKKRNLDVDIHTSTNGLGLMRSEVIDFLHKHNIKLQLSHDGLGQSYRTGEIDPIYDIPNVRECIKDGTINWINTTLNCHNYSLFKNRDYWLKVLSEIFPDVFDKNKICSREDDYTYRHLFIKLNHIYDGGLFSFTDRDILYDYIREWYDVYFSLRNAKSDNIYWMPFRNYLWSQCHRYRDVTFVDGKPLSGACQAFQSGVRDYTFVIDTMGRYSQCNLIDSDHRVENPTASVPEYCSDCRYKNKAECNGCGSVPRPKECIYLKEWMRFQETIWKFENVEKRYASTRSCNRR